MEVCKTKDYILYLKPYRLRQFLRKDSVGIWEKNWNRSNKINSEQLRKEIEFSVRNHLYLANFSILYVSGKHKIFLPSHKCKSSSLLEKKIKEKTETFWSPKFRNILNAFYFTLNKLNSSCFSSSKRHNIWNRIRHIIAYLLWVTRSWGITARIKADEKSNKI